MKPAQLTKIEKPMKQNKIKKQNENRTRNLFSGTW